ncbi:protein kinase domain-containing protein [Haloechinothrix sp. LS1_15]|uniref:serine/threonine-protein kinase n=1 Tax=Haloechinothrix sp. LS1_15 TaxID=2652248 RepID=UPI0029462B9D|nr:protein kinase [Haloechinothrix sp. LS1_15]MDV6010937.1 protein kinase [Haloechinothrix sp. LS1_15]
MVGSTVLGGRYELGASLGAGGMAQVYAARDRTLDRDVAIKLMHDHIAGEPTARERLLREARAAAALQHPNTVSVYDVGEDAGRPFIVMELVAGRSLEHRLRDEGGLAVAEAVEIADATLGALAAAHQRGLVHRDVKPSNILLPDAGGIKLADFGIAAALAANTSRLTSTGMMIGTPRYVAPEQAAGRQPSAAGDVYSVGVVLYECLTGRAPFEAETPVAEALAHQRDPVPPLAEVAPHVPAGVASVVERALAKDPAERYGDADGMRRALASGGTAPRPRVTKMLPAAAQPYGSPPATGSGRRRWALIALVAVVALFVAAALAAPEHRIAGEASPAERINPAAGENDEPDDAADEPHGSGEERAEPDPDDTGVAAAPDDLNELIAEVARDPEAAGERGDKLLDKLRDVRDADEDKRPERARKLVTDVAEWLADGKVEPVLGRQSITVLEREGRPQSPELARTSGLFAEIARDMQAWGAESDSLLSDIESLLGEEDQEDWAEDADDLIEDLEEWIDDGDIHRERGGQALSVLRPLSDSD